MLGDTLCKLDRGVRGCVIKHIIQQVWLLGLYLPKDFVLTECAAVHDQRLMLLSKKEKLQTATDKITHIENALCTDTPQPLAALPQLHQIPDAVEHTSSEHESRSEGVPDQTAYKTRKEKKKKKNKKSR